MGWRRQLEGKIGTINHIHNKIILKKNIRNYGTKQTLINEKIDKANDVFIVLFQSKKPKVTQADHLETYRLLLWDFETVVVFHSG